MKKWLLKILTGVLAVGAGAAAYLFYQSIERPLVYKIDGIYDEAESLKSAVIEASNVSLENKTLSGSLTIKSDGSHDVYLKNVKVEGDIVVKGAKEEFTLYLDDVTSRKVKIDSEVPVHLEVQANSSIKDVETNQDITVNENVLLTSSGIRNLTVRNNDDTQVVLKNAVLDMMVLDSKANVIMDETSLVENMIVNKPSNLVNQGSIGLLSANANVTYLNKPESIAAGEKVTVRDVNEVTTKVTTTKATAKESTAQETSGRQTSRQTTSARRTTAKTSAVTTTTKKSTATTKASTATSKPANTPPIITGEDVILTVGAKFNPLQGVTVTDAEDGRGKLTEANIIWNDVDTTYAGYYSVTYSYTDKGGLTTIFTRNVTVKQDEKRMAAPKNLRYSYDSEGGLQFMWDTVSGAYDYNVYVNGALVESGVRRNYAYVEDYVNINKPNELAVVAYSSPAANLEPSVPASITYTPEEGYINMPSVIHAGSTKKTSIFFRFFDLFVNTRPINKVKVKVERYVNRKYEPVSDLRLATTKRTDENGEIMIYDYARSGYSLDAEFTLQGSYRITMMLMDDRGVIQTLEHKFDVTGSNGTIDEVNHEPVISDFYVTYYGGSSYVRTDWDAYLIFYLPYSINTRYPEDDISVTFYYHTANTAQAEIVTFTAGDLGLARKEISANQILRVVLSKGDSAAFDTFMNENFGTAVSISAKIVVSDSGKEFTTTTRKIRLV